LVRCLTKEKMFVFSSTRTLRCPGGSHLSCSACGSGGPRRGYTVSVLIPAWALHAGLKLSAGKAGGAMAAKEGVERVDQSVVVCLLVGIPVWGKRFPPPSCLSATAQCRLASRSWNRVLCGTCEWLVGTVPFVGRAQGESTEVLGCLCDGICSLIRKLRTLRCSWFLAAAMVTRKSRCPRIEDAGTACLAARGKISALVPKEGLPMCRGCRTVWCTSAGRFFDACVFLLLFGWCLARIRLLLVLERRVVAGP